VLQESAVWEAVSWGGMGAAPLSLRFEGSELKTVRVYDMRHELERPGYAIEALIGERESYASGSELSFTLHVSTDLQH
jgi:hypothetical protein